MYCYFYLDVCRLCAWAIIFSHFNSCLTWDLKIFGHTKQIYSVSGKCSIQYNFWRIFATQIYSNWKQMRSVLFQHLVCSIFFLIVSRRLHWIKCFIWNMRSPRCKCKTDGTRLWITSIKRHIFNNSRLWMAINHCPHLVPYAFVRYVTFH